MNKLDQYKKAYDNSFEYDLDNKLILHWYPKRVAKKMVQGSLLELGLGHGYTAREFERITSDYTVIDGSPEIISEFKKKNPDLSHIKIVQSCFENFVPDRLFDNIIMGFVLEHVDNPSAIIAQYTDYLEQNGRMFITVPNSQSMHRRLGYMAGLMEKMDILSSADLQLGHKRYFSCTSLRNLIKQNGLCIVSEEGLFLKPLTTPQLKSLDFDNKVFEAMMKLGIEYPELSAGLLFEVAHG